MTVLMISDRIIGLVSTLILVRLLVPADFGIVAMCTSVIALLELFTAFGFDMVLINRQQAGRDHYDTAWTLSVLFGLLVAMLLAGAAYPTAAFYQEPRVIEPMLVLAFAFLLRSFENIAVVDFRKNMQFRKELIFQLSQKVIGFCITVPLAFLLRNYWALVLGILGTSVSRVVLGYVMKPYRPRLTLIQHKDILGFSSWMLAMNVAAFLRRRSSDFILGRYIGAHGLGLFQVGMEVASQPTTQLIAAINRAVYPGYARLGGDLERLRSTLLQVVTLISMAALPIAFGISAISSLLVQVVLGEGWDEIVPIIPILAMHGALGALMSNANYIFYAVDRPRHAAVVTMVLGPITVVGLVAAVKSFGLIGAAWVQLGVLVAALVPVMLLLKRAIGLPLTKWAHAIWRPLVSAIVMYAIVTWHVQTQPHGPLALLTAIAVGACSYVVILLSISSLSRAADSFEKQLFTTHIVPILRRFASIVR